MKILKKYGVVIVLLFLVTNFSYSQNSKIDSLQKILEVAKEDSNKAEILVQLAKLTSDFDREKSIEYYLEALRFEKDKNKKAVILYPIGIYNWQLGNFQESIEYYKKALTLFAELKDSTWLGKVYNNLGVVNWGLGNSIEALEFYQKALKIRKRINDKKGVSIILNNIGLIYQGWGLFKDALEWHKEALAIAMEIEKYSVIAYSYSNFGKCYENEKNYEDALKYYQLGYKNLLMKEKNSRSCSFFLASIGGAYSEMGKLDSALVYYKSSLLHAIRINNKNRIAIAEYNLGLTNFKLNRIAAAEKYINSSYDKSVENSYTNLIKNNLFTLSKIEESKGDISKALKYFKNATAIKDSTFNSEKIAKFTALQVKFQLEQQSQENEMLRKNSEIQSLTISRQNDSKNILIVTSIVFLIILLVITKSRKSFKKLNVKLKASERELLKINANKDKFFSIISHDLKSPFSSLIGAIDVLDAEQNELSPEETKEMIQIIKHTSNNVYQLLDVLLAWARTQIDGMNLKFEQIKISDVTNQVFDLLHINAEVKNISLINSLSENDFVQADLLALDTVLRNLVSNGIKFTKPNGKIIIESKKNDNEVQIIVSDSGVGLSKSDIDKLFRIEIHHISIGTNKETGTGIGLILCKELVEKHGGKIWVESELGVGSKFMFSLPAVKVLKS